ncbi:MAG: ABC transporter ATP-binding protein [Gammaproteobacteria bacterium]|nr:ABC transporter ATP-binding protein [Gammaproteobacteria bacterium]MCI0591239.1 ABC transporter ATP-binding protein [Gammaproteobacteria bacterium]
MKHVLELKEITLGYGKQKVVEAISFALSEGQIGCLLGPSACGKTTVLRAIAGFERPFSGEILMKGVKVSGKARIVPPERRQVGMVFQDFALFPHLTVHDNIAFGLAKHSNAARTRRTTQLAKLLGIENIRTQYPHQISGGQQQRVALARAIAPRPQILLLDEPFSSMDVELREQVAKEVRVILKQDRTTTMLVSHHQLEAFAMADVVGVMNNGQLLQWDTAYNLYHRPACTYVADFVGEGVFLSGSVVDEHHVQTELGIICGVVPVEFEKGSPVEVLIRPDDIIHDDNSNQTAIVIDKVFRGAEFLYTLCLDSGAQVVSLVPSHHDHHLNEPIGIRLEIDHLVVFPRDENQAQTSALS